MPNVDSLNIQVSATAQKASNSLDGLIGKFQSLSTALQGIQVTEIKGFSDSMSGLATAMQGMKGVSADGFKNVAKGMEAIGKIKPSTVNSASDAIGRLGKSLNFVVGADLKGGAEQIKEVATAIKQLGFKSSTKAIDNIPKLATAMRQLMTELSKAPRVSQNLIDMTNALGNLARTGSSSGMAYTSLSKSMNLFSGSTKTAKKHSFSLAGAIGKVYATYWLLFRAVGKVKDAIDISSQLTEVQNVVNTTFGNYRHLIEEFSNTSIVDFGMSELTAKKVSSTFQAMGTTMGFSQGKMADMSIELTKLTANMASFYNLEQEDVAEDLQSVFTGQTRPLRQYGLDLTEATLKEWALKNGMDANIKSMSQAEKTLLRYNYVLANTGAAQGDFKKTQMTWANQTRILSENFKALASVIGGTFINALKPMVVALNSAMGALISFAKTVSESLGKIFGWKYEDGSGGIANDYEDAADSAGDIADSTGTAAKNIKKMKAGLRAFDELKTINLPDNNSATGGSGGNTGGSGGSASGSGGQWTKVDSIFKDYESSLDNLYKLGDYIGTTLTSALNSIPWDKAYEGAKNFGKGLADFLNGLISPELFGAVGSTIAGALNTAINASLSFAENFDFEDFGLSIATAINNFFEDLDTASLGQSVSKWIKGGLSTVKTVLKQTDFEEIGKKIAEFVKNIDFSGIASSFSSVIIWALESGIELLGTLITEAPLETALIGAFSVFKFTGLGNSISGKISSSILGSLASVLGVDFGKDTKLSGVLIEGVKGIAGRVKDSDMLTALSSMGSKIWTGLGSAISTVTTGAANVISTVFSGLSTAVNGLATSAGSVIGTIASSVVGKIFIGLAVAFAAVKILQWLYKNTPFGDWVDDVGEFFSGLVTKGIEKITGIGDAIGKFFTETIPQEFAKHKDNAIEFMATIKGNVSESFTAMKAKWDGIKDKLATLTGQAKNATVDVFNDLKGKWDLVKDKISTLTGKAKNASDDVFKSLGNKWSTITSKTSTLTAKAKNSLGNAGKKISNAWSDIKSKTVKLTAKFVDNFTAPLKKAWNSVAKAINGFTGKINKTLNINIGQLPTFKGYATGGFPEDGTFRASHGEIMGRFDNGQSVVANNKQITDGISAAVYQGNRENNALLRQELELMKSQNELLRAILEKETGISSRDLFDSVRKSAYEYNKRTGNPAFVV